MNDKKFRIGDKISGEIAKVTIGRDGNTYIYLEFEDFYGVTIRLRD